MCTSCTKCLAVASFDGGIESWRFPALSDEEGFELGYKRAIARQQGCAQAVQKRSKVIASLDGSLKLTKFSSPSTEEMLESFFFVL